MEDLTDSYLQFTAVARRYSPRTVAIYRAVLDEYTEFTLGDALTSGQVDAAMNPTRIRNYEVHLLDEKGESPRTVNLHLSVLSGFAKYLMSRGLLKANPVRAVSRPKSEKRLPDFYRDGSITEYLTETAHSASEDELDLLLSYGGDTSSRAAREVYERRLRRLTVSLLHATAIRRAELISLNCGSVDLSRRILKVTGKGDKVREIPLIPALCEEISMYRQCVLSFLGIPDDPAQPLLVTLKGERLYPMYVDRAIKQELGAVPGITGRKSPHVLRHTLATELLNGGADLNSIKEFLGHSSLAATQVYTHNSIEKLKLVYRSAHPRAKEKE